MRACEARLDFAAPRARLPVYLGALGPRVLELAGAVADGVIVGNVATREGWDYALPRIAAGAASAGRELAEVRLTAWLYACVADDEQAALDAIRPMAATSLVTSRPVLRELGIEMPQAFARVMETRDWSLAREAVTEGRPRATRRAGPPVRACRYAGNLPAAPSGAARRHPADLAGHDRAFRPRHGIGRRDRAALHRGGSAGGGSVDVSVSMSGIVKRFGPVEALAGVDFDLRRGGFTLCSGRTVPARPR